MLPALKNGRGLLRSLFGFNQRTFGGFLFQRSALLRRISGGFTHRACPALGLATKELYTKTCALYPRSQKRSLTAHLVSSGLAAQKVVADECRQNSHKTICVRLTGTTAGVAVEFSTAP